MSKENESLKVDLKPYELALVQFGPSIALRDERGNSLIYLAAIEEIMSDSEGLTIVYRSGRKRVLTAEETKQFHERMMAGAKAIEDQMHAAQAQQAAQIGRQLGIIKGN